MHPARPDKRAACYGGNSNVSLLYGSLNSGNPTSFASIADGTQLSTVGWTTM